jgi:hypothetical protein
MDIMAGISRLPQAQVQEAASTYALKKSMETAKETASQLIESTQKAAPTYSNPPNLGNSIDVKA